MTNIKKPIFIWGAPRSGTTLLYNILAKHPDVVYPSDDFGRPKEGTRFWWTALGEVRSNLSKRHYTEKSASEIRGIYYDLVKSPDQRLLDKCPFYALWIPLINIVFPDSIHIHIIRDPRAVVNSIMYKLRYSKNEKDRIFQTNKLIFGPQPESIKEKHSLPSAAYHFLQWKEINLEGLKYRNLLGERYCQLKYEDLIDKPIQLIEELISILQLTPTNINDMLKGFNLENRNEKWKGKNLLTDDQFRTTKALSEEDLKYFQHVEDLFIELGYS